MAKNLATKSYGNGYFIKHNMEKFAIIDLGTNTFNLLVAEKVNNKEFKLIYSEKIPVKLGEGGINKGVIEPIPFERGINALRTYKKKIEEIGIEQISAFATSAIRSAQNGKDFVAKALAETGIAIQVINGNREAELIYKGVKLAVDVDDEYALIMDIGGGSTEFILCSQQGIVWKKSFDLGAARLLEKFKPSEPITKDEISTLKTHLLTHLQELWQIAKQHRITCLIGSSGSFDSFTEMVCAKHNQKINLKEIKNFKLEISEFEELFSQIIKSNREERMQIPGLVEMRVDMIVISSILTKLVLDELYLNKIMVSTYALKEGVLHELMNQ
jgi:exopolyphosphatase/guanosine-5'-triphosphate,3'-diphosphate pyrophosphatase